MFKSLFISGLILGLSTLSLSAQDMDMNNEKNLEKATFGAGCFWCVEAIYEIVEGIEHVESGYSGGHIENPSYREVTSGRTGHAEVARIHFDPNVISYEELLEVLWHTHNPTTLNRQGNDVGTQYRSVIFYHNEEQKKIAEASLKKTDESDLWDDPIVTKIQPLENYFVAENYHQNYFENNPNAGYCSFVIAPKVKKFKKEFSHLLKETEKVN
ncbi:MAG: peptide-methionine (S)-S-oxide reductase [Balneola sp.]|jgi:peptide-methionine (S)-S-oxide reductase|nr:peptide-methionine (S)-S-oxide reductase [Balneola sp.]MBE79099.1 peptide-methionine (S)-S-oxide reductase [Balneola sp.]|tara:strand:- start:1419 stop:2057 length:639 start_codon:yes stop_codon:yes gene_type:complete